MAAAVACAAAAVKCGRGVAVEDTAQIVLDVLEHQENTAHKHISTKTTSLPSTVDVESDCQHKAGCRVLCGTAPQIRKAISIAAVGEQCVLRDVTLID
jgi:hypothetical protein